MVDGTFLPSSASFVQAPSKPTYEQVIEALNEKRKAVQALKKKIQQRDTREALVGAHLPPTVWPWGRTMRRAFPVRSAVSLGSCCCSVSILASQIMMGIFTMFIFDWWLLGR